MEAARGQRPERRRRLGAPPAFHLLAKPTGAVCNLDCSYCFFLSKEMLYPGSRFRMADDLLEAYVRQLIEAHARAPEVTIAWQGGEPTMMGVDVLPPLGRARRAIPAPGQRAIYTIQTNGTLLDEEWAAFFKEHDFLVGISIDGPREIHDAYRVNKGGKGTFDQVMRGLGHLAAADVDVERADDGARGQRRARPRGVPLPARRVRRRVHAVHPDHRAGDRGRRTTGRCRGRRGATGRSTCRRATRVTGRSVTAEQYGRFLIDVFEEWVRRDVGEVYVQMFDVALANWVGEPPGLCVHSRDVRARARARAHRRPLLVRPLRRAALQARQHHASSTCSSSSPPTSSGSSGSTSATRSPATAANATCGSPATAAARRTGSSRRPTASPGLQLPLHRLQGVLPPRRPADADHGASCSPHNRAPSEIVVAVRGRGRQARPQRSVHVRRRPQVEAVPWGAAAADGADERAARFIPDHPHGMTMTAT